MVDTNVDAVLRPLTEKERVVQEVLQTTPTETLRGWSSGNTGETRYLKAALKLNYFDI